MNSLTTHHRPTQWASGSSRWLRLEGWVRCAALLVGGAAVVRFLRLAVMAGLVVLATARTASAAEAPLCDPSGASMPAPVEVRAASGANLDELPCDAPLYWRWSGVDWEHRIGEGPGPVPQRPQPFDWQLSELGAFLSLPALAEHQPEQMDLPAVPTIGRALAGTRRNIDRPPSSAL